MKKVGIRKYIVIGVFALAAIVLASLIIILKSQNRKAMPAEKPAEAFAAELVSATGMIFVGKPGGTEWHQVAVGAHLMEGDLVQTDSLGEASIRYTNGATVSIQASTVFTVRSAGDGSMEISVPLQESGSPSIALSSDGEESGQSAEKPGATTGPANSASAKGSSPFIKLDRIVRFGRSLELIGSVEAGSRLTVNNESVDVAGDGTFKHFTNQFPANAGKVRLALKVTNLAGRTRVVTTTYDFDPQGGDT